MARRGYRDCLLPISCLEYWIRVPRIHFAFVKFYFDRNVGISWQTPWHPLLAIVLCRRRNYRHDSLVQLVK